MVHRLFAYGTLRPKHAPAEIADVVAQFEFVGAGDIQGLLFDFGEYPGALRTTNRNERIRGSVFQFPDDPELLERLDQYEGFNPKDRKNSLFVRELRRVAMRDGSRKLCWAYRYNRSVDKKRRPTSQSAPGRKINSSW